MSTKFTIHHFSVSTIIQISAAAAESGNALRPYVIRGLGQLSGFGFSLELDEDISPANLKVLRREDIPFSTVKPSPENERSISISGDESGLVLHHPESGTMKFASWQDLTGFLLFPPRTGHVTRTTKETRIVVDINLDGSGKFDISTGLGFFDHMLEQIARHGGVDLTVKCDGDLHIDEHHTIEDTALALGDAISQALGDKRGITRYASVLPMDETRAMVALDLSGRPYLVFDASFTREKVGDVPTEMIKHFFYSLAMNTKSTLHIEVTGENDHHKIEASFKGFAIVLKNAVKRTGSNEIPSSKGVL